MALRIIDSANADFISQSLISNLIDAYNQGKRPVCLVPTLKDANDLKKTLAQNKAGLGIEVDCIESYLERMWLMWGDERCFISPSARYIYMQDALLASGLISADEEGHSTSAAICAGTIRSACSDIIQTAGYIKVDPQTDVEIDQMESGFKTLYKGYEIYIQSIEDNSLIEPAYAYALIPSKMNEKCVQMPEVYFAGFSYIDPAYLLFIREYAKVADINVVYNIEDNPSFNLTRLNRKQLIDVLNRQGVAFDEAAWGEKDIYEAQDELTVLSENIFLPLNEPLVPHGHVDLIMPSGIHAEAEVAVKKTEQLIDEGIDEIYICSSEREGLYNNLVDKLAQRNISFEATISKNLSSSTIFNITLTYLKTVLTLLSLEDLTVKELDYTTWWPPVGLTDFFLTSMSGMDADTAWRLDAQWRSNRILTPNDVLKKLSRKNDSSKAIMQSVADLRNGRVYKAIVDIANDFKDRNSEHVYEPWYLETVCTLEAFASVVHELNKCEHNLFPKGKKDYEAMLSAFDFVVEIAKTKSISYSVCCKAPDEKARVICISPNEVATMRPRSIEALIYIGLDNIRNSIGITNTQTNVLVSKLARIDLFDPLMSERCQFGKIIRTPKEHLTLERVAYLNKEETFNSVVLGELLGAYGFDPLKKNIPLDCMGGIETCVIENISPSGNDDAATTQTDIYPIGQLDDKLKDIILISSSKEGSEETSPILSASQIESYLSCPYNWFTNRRIKLQDSDAEFNSMTKGTFVHRVLELTFKKHLAGILNISEDEVDSYFDTHNIAESIEGSAITSENVSDFLDLARKEFDEHYERQFLSAGNKYQQLLIPHTPVDKIELATIKRDIEETIKWHVGKLKGYEPRLFEYSFGSDSSSVEYAGVRFTGTIDRVDVDSQGNAVILDYKYKNLKFSDNEYSLYRNTKLTEFELPQNVQSLIYAQVLRRVRPDLNPVASLYLSPMSRCITGSYANAGVFSHVTGDFDAMAGSATRIVNPEHGLSFFDILDKTEELIAVEIEKMKRGDIAPRPRKKNSCLYCKVKSCEKRI